MDQIYGSLQLLVATVFFSYHSTASRNEVIAFIGGSATLPCIPTENGLEIVGWTRKWNESQKNLEIKCYDDSKFILQLFRKYILRGSAGSCSQDPRHFMDETNSLVIMGVTYADAGEYLCRWQQNGHVKWVYTALEVRNMSTTDKPERPEMGARSRSTGIAAISAAVVVALFAMFCGLCVLLYKIKKTEKTKTPSLMPAPDLFREILVPNMQVIPVETEAAYLGQVNLLLCQRPLMNSQEAEAMDLFPGQTRLHHSNTTDDKNVTIARHLRGALGPLWAIPQEHLSLRMLLGQGEFGKVWAANILGAPLRGHSLVAVKVLKVEQSVLPMEVNFWHEVRLMTMLSRNVNVIGFLGYSQSSDGTLMAIMEYAPGGSLANYLRAHRPLYGNVENPIGSHKVPGSLRLVEIALGVARGLTHIANHGVIHHDVAARNVLIGADDTFKVCDFGLARHQSESDKLSAQASIPFRWYPPEYFSRQQYTHAGDVWAFGVFLWELVTFAYTPYQEIASHQVLASRLLRGYRMPCPSHCSKAMYELMMACWEPEPDHRPTFAQLWQRLSYLYQANKQYVNLAEFGSEVYVDLVPLPGEKL
uniref:fibroblast growth factor receptor 2-like isoform X2 n=1 Tax=Myxine glutinosa TaxID=7769 RepID=UPI00358E5744